MYELSPEAREEARRLFQGVLDSAVMAYEMGQLNLFHDDEESFIKKEVERKLHDPGLANAGSRERRWVERLKRMARDRDWAGAGKASYAARRWGEVLPDDPRNPGRYYLRREITPKTNKKEYEWLKDLAEIAESNKDWNRKWFAEMLLEGMPEGISNFAIECLFLLRGSDGTVTRLVRLRNMLGETSRGPNPGGCEILDAEAFCAPEKFRKWCLARGNFNWAGNQTELHKLHEDVGRSMAWRVVNQVESCGWLQIPKAEKLKAETQKEDTTDCLEGIWFFDECAYANGLMLKPDDDGIFWHHGEGYYLARKGRESQFLHGRPRMQPKVRVEDCKFKFDTWAQPPEKKSGEEILRCFFRELCRRLRETLGAAPLGEASEEELKAQRLAGYEAHLALGSIFAYAAAPEIFDEYGLFPGLWVHGQAQSGKTNFTSWLMSIAGFNLQSGIGIVQTATAVGMLQEAENYSNLPVWMDEFREFQVEPVKIAILRNAFNRQVQAKWSPDGLQRTMRTAYVVSGESTSSDAAVRSRYPHIQVSATKRKRNHLEWFNAHKQWFFLFFRLLMERRPEFVALFKHFLKTWLHKRELEGVEEREKMVYGIAYSAWMAMEGLLVAYKPDELAPFEEFMLKHSTSANQDVTSETNINVFQGDLLTAFKAEAIPLSCFRKESRRIDHPPGAEGLNAEGKLAQAGWESVDLYFDPELLISHLRVFMQKQRADVVLKRKDLRDQLAANAYWIPTQWTGADGRLRKLRKRIGGGSVACWGFRLDLHPMGYQQVSDEEYTDWILRRGDSDEGDPRKGPLYVIVEKLKDEERKKE